MGELGTTDRKRLLIRLRPFMYGVMGTPLVPAEGQSGVRGLNYETDTVKCCGCFLADNRSLSLENRESAHTAKATTSTKRTTINQPMLDSVSTPQPFWLIGGRIIMRRWT